MLRELNGSNVRVFVIWEPVLPTDLASPSTATLARVSDTRASQYWDRGRVLSHLMGEHDRRSAVWDFIAVYEPEEIWNDAPPKPAFSARPVVYVIDGAKDKISQLTKK